MRPVTASVRRRRRCHRRRASAGVRPERLSSRCSAAAVERPHQLEAERLEPFDLETRADDERMEQLGRIRRGRRLDLTAAAAQSEKPHESGPGRVQNARYDVPRIVGREDQGTSRLQYACQLPHCRRRIEYMLDHLGAQHEIELAAVERQSLEVRLSQLGVGNCNLRRRQNPLRDVDSCDALREVGAQRGQIAAVAAAGVEKRLHGQLLPNELRDARELSVDPRIRGSFWLRVLLLCALLVQAAHAVGRVTHRGEATGPERRRVSSVVRRTSGSRPRRRRLPREPA